MEELKKQKPNSENQDKNKQNIKLKPKLKQLHTKPPKHTQPLTPHSQTSKNKNTKTKSKSRSSSVHSQYKTKPNKPPKPPKNNRNTKNANKNKKKTPSIQKLNKKSVPSLVDDYKSNNYENNEFEDSENESQEESQYEEESKQEHDEDTSQLQSEHNSKEDPEEEQEETELEDENEEQESEWIEESQELKSEGHLENESGEEQEEDEEDEEEEEEDDEEQKEEDHQSQKEEESEFIDEEQSNDEKNKSYSNERSEGSIQNNEENQSDESNSNDESSEKDLNQGELKKSSLDDHEESEEESEDEENSQNEENKQESENDDSNSEHSKEEDKEEDEEEEDWDEEEEEFEDDDYSVEIEDEEENSIDEEVNQWAESISPSEKEKQFYKKESFKDEAQFPSNAEIESLFPLEINKQTSQSISKESAIKPKIEESPAYLQRMPYNDETNTTFVDYYDTFKSQADTMGISLSKELKGFQTLSKKKEFQPTPVRDDWFYFTNFFEDDSYDFYYYNLKKEKGYKVNIQNTSIPSYSDAININDKIYITGGFSIQFLKVCYEYTRNLNSLSTKSEMNVPKRQHTLVNLNDQVFYSLGGENSNGMLDICECYDIVKDKWSLMCPLNQQKASIGGCSFLQEFIYAFGGNNDETTFDTIEKFDCKLNTWEIINLTINKGWSPRSGCGCIQISSGTILVMGGEAKLKKTFTFAFKPFTNQIWKLKSSLIKRAKFHGRKPFFLRTQGLLNVCCLGFESKDLHVFSIHEKNWRVVKKSSFQPNIKCKIKFKGIEKIN